MLRSDAGQGVPQSVSYFKIKIVLYSLFRLYFDRIGIINVFGILSIDRTTVLKLLFIQWLFVECWGTYAQ